jgi:hypothetical protein
MVVPPPLADLRHPADRWQTVFAITVLLAGKSMQNAERCDIPATVSVQAGKSRPIVPRLFRNTEQCVRHPRGLDVVTWQPNKSL